MKRDLADSDSVSKYFSSVYEKKRSKNPAYSMRAFARNLGISISHLSEVISGRKGISWKLCQNLAEGLSLSVSEMEYLWALSERQFSKSPAKRNTANAILEEIRRSTKVKKISSAEFHPVGEWYHFAILELCRLNDKIANAEAIGEILELPVPRVIEAFKNLRAAGLLEIKDGKYIPNKSVAVQSGPPSSVVRKFHSEIVKRAYASIETQDTNSRLLSSNISAVRRSDLPSAYARIEEFVARFIAEFGTVSENDSVYALSIQFFDLFKDLDPSAHGRLRN